ncbi:hypothetical protein [Kutzneria albida]|uniref:Helix-turn-helix domain-containing protein n=1 Tax=Kutzneria albida DSM 43870 TaxID=1449976 RepID=W5WC24_9PSEU|nr:hypothetical protein [Kutzneria albida]AHH98305.1 hypothetical protein KALB_4943 [Kutzneria albida DSM 43870]
MIKPRRWPIPGDTALDAARAIAREYRRALQLVDPDTCAHLDRQAEVFGQQWLLPTVAIHGENDLVTLDVAAELVGRSRDMIYKWARRDQRLTAHPGSDGRLRVRVGDVENVDAEMRQRRAQRHQT